MKPLDESLLDDPERIAAGDPGEMLRAVATSAAQVREAWWLAHEAVGALASEGRPRSVVVCGMGGSGIAGDVLAAVAGVSCPVPVLTVRGYALPGWVGAADLVIAVSCSGATEETVACAREAVRRGCRLQVVAPEGSLLAAVAEQGRALLVPVRAAGRQPRAVMWALSMPLLAAGRSLGLAEVPDSAVEATAARLEDAAARCRPASESFLNPAKELALQLAGSLPMVWGTSMISGVAAHRMACQLAENAKYPALSGQLPEPNHNQVVAWDGVFGAAGGPADDDFFRDRTAGDADVRLRLVVLRDRAGEHPAVARRADASVQLAEKRGLAVTQLEAEGQSPLERLASVVALVDYASVYLALGLGIDPTPVAPITELKQQITG